MTRQPQTPPASPATGRRPRLGFVGVGWIGRHRLHAVAASGLAEVAAVCDPDAEAVGAVRAEVPAAREMTFADMLGERLDGIVIATPSAQHAEQARAALEAGCAVYVQKPVGRDATETAAVLDAARRADRRLGVDFCYRHTRGMQALRRLVAAGELGAPFALDLVFHNAYGPDKPWFYDIAKAGGGCVMDLGIHLVDLALWLFGTDDVADVQAHRLAQGRPAGPGDVEDFAAVQLAFGEGRVARLACSWNLPAGQDAVIGVDVYGTDGGAALRNVGGSFFDFRTECFRGTARETLDEPPEDWGGRSIVAWTQALARDPSFAPEAESALAVARVLDRIYGRPRHA